MGSTFNLTRSSKYPEGGNAMYVLLTTSFANINIYLNEKWDIEMDRQNIWAFFRCYLNPRHVNSLGLRRKNFNQERHKITLLQYNKEFFKLQMK